MALPKERLMELPLLHEIQQRGGTAKPDTALYESVARHFPGITPDDLKLVKASDGSNKWANRVCWARNSLADKGEIDRSTRGARGVWRITDMGRERLAREWPQWSPPQPPQIIPPPVITPPPPVGPSPAIAERIRQRLEALTPQQFEHFVGQYLKRKGLGNIRVTGRSHDGGIDGNAEEPFLGIKVAFQAKRWTSGPNIRATYIRELLGSITMRNFERGLFITTASFTDEAKEEAKDSQGKIILIDSHRLVQDCIDMQLGIKPVVTKADIDEDFFSSLQ